MDQCTTSPDLACSTCLFLKRLWGDRSGASAVEFAVVLPVFLMLMLGILAHGIYYGAAHCTAQLAADAARASVAGLDDAERTSIAKGVIAKTASMYPLLIADKIAVEAAASASDPTEFMVAVRYDSAHLPIWSFSKLIPLPSKIIQRTAVIKRGGY
ncbi:MAG: TadE/TadG family type IV pilus assembly protein [Hyphomicrobium sp.]